MGCLGQLIAVLIMHSHFVHKLPLEIGSIFGMPLYWYGAVYSIGFLGIFFWLFIRRDKMGFNKREVYGFTIFAAVGILIGGRAFDIAVYELEYYRHNPLSSINWWEGGLASHGVLLGSLAATILFCRLHKKPFLTVVDELVVPAAFLFAVGRIGNFIEGGVIGIQTEVPWAVLYENLDGARHPVAIYESAKNFLIVPVLMIVLRYYPAGRGVSFASFIFLYAILRFIVDLYRDYEAYWWGLNKGQFFNLGMAIVGLTLLIFFLRRSNTMKLEHRALSQEEPVGIIYRAVLALLVIYPLGIPTSWTQANIEQQREQTSDQMKSVE